MSGGYWDYIQYRFRDIADDIQRIIDENDATEVNEWGDVRGRHYKPETIAKLEQAVRHIRETEVMLQRVDYLLESDDSEETFHERWKEDMEALDEQSK